jgi:hypothetical protein
MAKRKPKVPTVDEVAAGLPEPSNRERAMIEQAEARRKARGPRHQVKINRYKDTMYSMPTHADPPGWLDRHLDTFGQAQPSIPRSSYGECSMRSGRQAAPSLTRN